jgi:hypothetical protein
LSPILNNSIGKTYLKTLVHNSIYFTKTMLGVYIGAGFCNRVFQMLYAYSFARKYGLSFRFEGWQLKNHHSDQVYEWLVKRFESLPNYHSSDVVYDEEVKEPGELFTHALDLSPQLLAARYKNILVCGFFQNENYFKEYKEDVLQLLREPEFITNAIQEKMSGLLPLLDEAYFVHIRLGDYLMLEKHWIHLEEYYIRVITHICQKEPTPVFLLFCNFPGDIPRVYPHLLHFLEKHNIRHIVITDQDELLNIYLMVRCKKGGICANSTFGWWAGWLNKNPSKEIYMPSRWITGPEEIRIYPEGAMVVNI